MQVTICLKSGKLTSGGNKKVVTFRDNTTLERIGHFQSWSDRKKLTSVKWRLDCCGKRILESIPKVNINKWCRKLKGIFENQSEKVMVDSRIVVQRRPSGVAHAAIGQILFPSYTSSIIYILIFSSRHLLKTRLKSWNKVELWPDFKFHAAASEKLKPHYLFNFRST